MAAGDEAGQPAGPQQVERAAEEVVVDAEAAIGPVARIGHLVGAEGHVADGQVVPAVGQGRLLERADAHVHAAGAVQRLQHPAREPVDLDGGDPAMLNQCGRHSADEVADAGAGFEHAAAGESEALHCLPHRLDHEDRGVVAIVHRRARRRVVVVGEGVAQLRGTACPGRLRRLKVEARWQTAPAGVAQQRAARVAVRCTVRRFELTQRVDRGQVGLELRDRAAGDVEAGERQPRPAWPLGGGHWRFGRLPRG